MRPACSRESNVNPQLFCAARVCSLRYCDSVTKVLNKWNKDAAVQMEITRESATNTEMTYPCASEVCQDARNEA